MQKGAHATCDAYVKAATRKQGQGGMKKETGMTENADAAVLKKFKDYASSIMNPSVEKWKTGGGRVMGYTCSFVPEELFIAAGLLPYRIRAAGSKTAGQADDYFEAANICSLIRHTFGRVLSGDYGFLDGAVIGGGCDANRHIFDNWKRCPVKTLFLETIFFPHSVGEPMAGYFRDELAEIKARMERHFGVIVADDRLWAAIKLCNETRDLQKELYGLRKSDHPPMTGAETVAVIVAGSSMPREEYNADLKRLLEALKTSPISGKKYQARIMIVGPGHDDTSMCDIVESLGGLVVTDLTCFGSKVAIGRVDESGSDPLKALADYQVLVRPLCPKNLGAQACINKEVFERIEDCRVDGIIGQNFLCCDMWGGALYILNKALKKAGIPMLRIEREYSADSTGQLRTRVQAFIETVSGGAL